ncbi:MAG: hypothetical protein IH986_05400, partial [Planctomycetes bacterium]|nr:hypothetical protein [Planctomycetota bacterium]
MQKVTALIDELEGTIKTSFEPVTISVTHAPASQVAAMIWQFLGDPIVQEGGRGEARRGPQIIPNDKANKLVVRGSKAEVERIRMLAEQFDDPSQITTNIKVVSIPQGQDVFEMAGLVQDIINGGEQINADKENRIADQIVVSADDYTHTLIVSGDPRMFGLVDDLVERLRDISPPGSVTRVIEFSNLSAEDAVEMINELQNRRSGGSSSRRGTSRGGTRSGISRPSGSTRNRSTGGGNRSFNRSGGNSNRGGANRGGNRGSSNRNRSGGGRRTGGRGAWLWDSSPRELRDDVRAPGGKFQPFVSLMLLPLFLDGGLLNKAALDDTRVDSVVAELQGRRGREPFDLTGGRVQPASLLRAERFLDEDPRDRTARGASQTRRSAKPMYASYRLALLQELDALGQDPPQRTTTRRQRRGEPAALRRAQDAQRELDDEPRQAAPRARIQERAQPQAGVRRITSVVGELRGEVGAVVLDRNRIVITGSADDVDFIEELLRRMELDAPQPMIEIFTLQNARATSLAPIVTEVIGEVIGIGTQSPRPGDRFSINAEARSNSLIVSATERNMAMIADMIGRLDLKSIDAPDFKAIPLKFVRAVEAVVQLQSTIERMGEARGLSAEERPAISAVDRANSILIVGTPSDIAEIGRLIDVIDIDIKADEDRFGTISHMIIVGLKNGSAEDIARVLTEMIDAEQDAAREATSGQAGRPVVRKLQLTGPDGEELPPLDLEKPIRILSETGTNSLIIFSTEQNNEALKQIVAVFDTLPAGEEIDVRAIVLEHANAEQVANMLQTLFDDSKKALRRAVEGDGTGKETGKMPPVPQGVAGKGLPHNVLVTHDARSNTIFIVGHKDAVLLASGLVQQLDKPSSEVLGTKPYILELKNLVASNMAEKLKDMLEQRAAVLGDNASKRDSAVITPYDRSNVLVIIATREVFDMLEELAMQLDDAEIYRSVDTRYHHLAYADAQKMQSLLQTVFDEKKKALDEQTEESKDVLSVTADVRSNSLVLTGTRDFLTEAEELIAKLDQGFDPTMEFKIRKVLLNSAANIAARLREMIDTSFTQQGDEGGTPIHISADPLSNSLILAASHEDMVNLERWIDLLDRPSELRRMISIIPLGNRRAEDLATAVESAFGPRADEEAADLTITPEATTNAIVVIGPPAIVKDIESFVRDFDAIEAVKGAIVKLFKLEEAHAQEAADLLNEILEGGAGGSSSEAAGQVVLFHQINDPEHGMQMLRAVRSEISVSAEERTNTLVVTAPPESMELMESLIKAIDLPPTALKIRVFALRNGDAEDMVDTLNDIFEQETQGTGAGDESETELALEGLGEGGREEISFTADVRTNSVIAAGTKGYLDLAEELILQIDSQEFVERTLSVYMPRNITAQSLGDSLSALNDAQQELLSELGDEMSFRDRMARQILTVANEDSNVLLVDHDQSNDIMEILREIDQPPPQVMIQVLILEVTMDNSLELGVEFAFQDLQFAKAGPSDTNTFDFVGGTDIGAAGSGLGGFTFTITGADFNFLLRTLQNEGRLNVLSRPQIIAMDNQLAEFRIINSVPFVTGSAAVAGQVTTTVGREDVGIVLEVTPQINPDGYVRMEIHQEVSDLTGSTIDIGQGVTAPIFFERVADTTVTVKDNETVVLGGLITTREESREQKVPILGDIPGLGLLFRNTVETSTRTELLIVITPRIIRTVEDYRDLSAEERDRTGILPDEVLTSPLMQGLRVEPGEIDNADTEDLLGPFPDEPILPNNGKDAPPPAGNEFGPRRPAKHKSGNGIKPDPNSYNVPITRRFTRRS